MLKRSILWIVPLVFMILIAAYFVLPSLTATHAAMWGG